MSSSEGTEWVVKKVEKLCEEYDLSFKKFAEVYHTVFPLFPVVMRNKEVQKGLMEASAMLVRTFKDSQETLGLIKGKRITPRQRSLLLLYLYLVESEGRFSRLVQSIVFLLVENRRIVVRNPDTNKIVRSYEELNKVPLGRKLRFIEDHKLKCISNSFDRELRNSIAHVKYIVEDKGTVILTETGKKYETEDILKKLNGLINMGHTILAVYSVLGQQAQIATLSFLKIELDKIFHENPEELNSND